MNLEQAIELSKLDCPRSDHAGEALRVLVAELERANETAARKQALADETRAEWNQRMRRALLREKELVSKLAAAEAERDRLRAGAKRYAWLCERRIKALGEDGDMVLHHRFGHLRNETLDESIDGLMEDGK